MIQFQTGNEEIPIPIHFELTQIIEDVKSGKKVSDFQFDKIYPHVVRQFSRPHWTSFEVAVRAASLLVNSPETRVLDIGSGVGKFCLIGALTTPGTFHGIEQRQHLTTIAQQVASCHHISRVSFMNGDMGCVNWSMYNAFYFFNPFYEHIYPSKHVDETMKLSPKRYQRCIRIAQEKLRTAPLGSRVVTYHGMGGEMPEGFVLMIREFRGSGPLELWMKNRS